MLKMFYADNCPNCPKVKDICQTLESKGVVVEYHNVLEVDGLTEITYYGLLTTPSIVCVDEDEEGIGSLQGNDITFEEVEELARRAQ